VNRQDAAIAHARRHYGKGKGKREMSKPRGGLPWRCGYCPRELNWGADPDAPQGRMVFECHSPRCGKKGKFRRVLTVGQVTAKFEAARNAGRSEVVID